MTHNKDKLKSRFGILPKLLIVLVLVSLLPLLVVWYLNYQTMMQQATLSARERLEAMAEVFVGRANVWMDMNVRMLRENAAEPDIRSMDPERQKPILRIISAEYPWIHSALVIGPDGKSISRADDMPLQDYSDRIYVQQVLAGKPLGQQVLIGKTTGLPALTLAVPIRSDGGTVQGILAVSMATALLSAYVAEIRIGDTGYAFLLDAAGKAIAHKSILNSNFQGDYSEHPAFLALTNDGESKLVYRDEERDASVIAYTKRTDAGWVLVTQQDYDETFQAVAVTNRYAIVTLVITLLAVLLVAALLSRRLTRPLRRLTRIANEASLANFAAINKDTLAKDRNDEIGELARSVERLAVSLRVAIGRLQKKS